MINYKGQFVLLLPKYYSIKNMEDRIFFCSGGEGCEPVSNISSIFGEFITDGEKCRVHSYHIARLASDYEIRKAMNKRKANEIKIFEKSTIEEGM